MAIDEALLSCFNPESSDPIIRFYGWNPPALSLGRFQKAGEVLDFEQCCSSSIQIVRRISGGGVIYHADELTYSIICSPAHIPSASSVKDSFRVLTGFLLDFYHAVGLDASYAVESVSDNSSLGVRTAFCFAGKESFDILIQGRKIGGNAQRRLKNVVFQHGSIPVYNRADKGATFMRDKDPALALGSTSVFDCGVTTTADRLKVILAMSFKNNMAIDLVPSLMSTEEQFRYQQLYDHKYSTDSWNIRGESE